MIKNIPNEVWAFDCEWVPDIEAGRLLYHLPDDLPTQEVLRVMWEQGGATQDNPTPFLRTLLCRIVSVAMVIRRVLPNGTVRLFLQSLPEDPEDPSQDEVYILNRFLKDGLSVHNPQLVGFNSRNSDLRILTQRALIHGLPQPRLCERLSAKPWESQDIDLMDFVSGFGKTYAVSLNELATLSGIPGNWTPVAMMSVGCGTVVSIARSSPITALTHSRPIWSGCAWPPSQDALILQTIASSNNASKHYLMNTLKNRRMRFCSHFSMLGVHSSNARAN